MTVRMIGRKVWQDVKAWMHTDILGDLRKGPRVTFEDGWYLQAWGSVSTIELDLV